MHTDEQTYEGGSYPLIVGTGATDLSNVEVRDHLNDVLDDIIDSAESDPVATYAHVREELLEYGFELPKVETMYGLHSEDSGEEIFQIQTKWDSNSVYFLYFGFAIDGGGFDILAEIMDGESLDKYLLGESLDD